jgi:hypothetical protein
MGDAGPLLWDSKHSERERERERESLVRQNQRLRSVEVDDQINV